MAQIELRLSAKTDKITGLNEVLVRFYEGSKFNLRSKTGIFVSTKHFEFYINREATEKKGIKIKTKDITATRSEAEKKGYVLLDRGIIVSNGIVENEDKKIHDLAIKKAKELCEHIINSFNESDRNSISSDWLKITIDRYQNPSKYQEKEIEKPSFFQIFETFLNEKASSDSWIKNYRVLFRTLARWEAYTIFKKDKNFKLDVDTIRREHIVDFKEYLRTEKTLSESYPKFFEKILKDYPVEIGTKRKSPKLVNRGHNTLVSTLKKLKAFFSWLNKTERSKNMPFLGFEIGSEKYGTPIALTLDELSTIAKYDFSKNPNLDTIRDIFIFQCLVGCRISDYLSLTPKNISNGYLFYIQDKTKNKTPKTVRVPLHSHALALIEKYKGVDSQGRLFPFLTAQRYNDNLKVIFKICNIDRTVIVLDPTGKSIPKPLYEEAINHIARKTFCSTLFGNKTDRDVIAKMSGHSPGSKAFNRYIDINDNTLEEAIEVFDIK